MTTLRERWRFLLPATAAVALGLGGLIYAGKKGTNCDGSRAAPVMAHPPFSWPWYVALIVVILGMCLVPLLTQRRNPRHPN
jgi:hypothetical protein